MKNLYLEIDTLPNPSPEALISEIMWDCRDSSEIENAMKKTGQADIRDRLLARTGETATLAGLSFGFEAPDPAHALHPYRADSGWVGDAGQTAAITEEKLLTGFWKLVSDADRIITYGQYQIPFLLARSAILGVKPTRQMYDIKPWDYTLTDLAFHRWKGTLIRPNLAQCLRLNGLPVTGMLSQADLQNLLTKEEPNLDAKYAALKAHGKAKIEGVRSLSGMWAGLFFPMLQPIG